MKVIQANNLNKQKVLVEFFDQDNYSGNSQKICAGDYNRDQILMENIRSMKLTEGAVIIFFSELGFSGQKAMVKQSLDAGGLRFACMKVHDGSTLELDDDDLDAVVGGVASACGGDLSGSSACVAYACGGAICGAAACVGAACGADGAGASVCAGDACALDGGGVGVCAGNACAANACGSDNCGANACPAAACGLNLCGANTCPGDVCGINLIPWLPFI